MRFRDHIIHVPLSVGDSVDRRRAELLSVLLLGRGVAAIGVLIFLVVMGPEKAIGPTLIAFTLNIVAYLLARTKYFQIGTAIVIIEALLVIPYTVISTGTLESIASGPIWLGLGTLIGSLVLPFRYMLLVIVGTAASFGVIGFHIDPSFMPIVAGQLLFTLVLSFLALVGTHIRDRGDKLLEAERAKVIQISKLSALGEMAAGIAHEINTPLGAIVLNAQMIERINSRLHDPNSDIAKRAQSIVKIGYRVAKIINGLKDFSGETKNEGDTTFTARALIAATIDLCGEKFKNHGVQLRIEENQWIEIRIRGQLNQLSQTLLNLLSNSFDAVQNLEEKWIQIKVVATGQNIELRVIDSGNGIAPQIVTKIFQPFFTTKDTGKGIGLGLGISKSIAESHHGDLFYDETSSKTCFVIRLPVVQKESESERLVT